MTLANALESFSDQIAALPEADQSKAVSEAIGSLPPAQKQAVAQALGIPIDGQTANKVWLIIIWAFSIIMAGAAGVLCIGVFVQTTNGITKPDMILTIFTTVTAFLAGLFSPSPVAKQGDR